MTRLQPIVAVRDGELKALLWAFAYFFCLLCAYYILRPLREEMGIAGGVRNLPWLFTATFGAMLLAVPLFGALVARVPRRRFLPFVYRFFIINILIFYLLLQLGVDRVIVGRIFFVWVSVFNLFVVSVFWSFMADLFKSSQGKRLFGFIAAGGSLGAILGPGITAALSLPLGPVHLLLVSALLLEAAVLCIRRLLQTATADDRPPEPPIGGGVLAGATEVLRQPYLIWICLYILFFTTTSTFLYFQQAELVAAAFEDPAERTRVFALIDLSVGILTVLVQLAVTGKILARFGLGVGLAFLPLLTCAGFLAFVVAPQLAALVAFQSIRRAANFALSKPAREVLFTVVGQEAKYKSKNFIDTVVYRGGDAVSGWAYAGLGAIGLGLQGIAAVALPIAGLWMILGFYLGRAHRQRAAAQDA